MALPRFLRIESPRISMRWDAKLPKLSKIDGYDRRVLLILNGFVLAEASEIVAALKRRSLEAGHLDAIYFISYGWKDTTLVADAGFRRRSDRRHPGR